MYGANFGWQDAFFDRLRKNEPAHDRRHLFAGCQIPFLVSRDISRRQFLPQMSWTLLASIADFTFDQALFAVATFNEAKDYLLLYLAQGSLTSLGVVSQSDFIGMRRIYYLFFLLIIILLHLFLFFIYFY
jgi:hypothetical protein